MLLPQEGPRTVHLCICCRCFMLVVGVRGAWGWWGGWGGEGRWTEGCMYVGRLPQPTLKRHHRPSCIHTHSIIHAHIYVCIYINAPAAPPGRSPSSPRPAPSPPPCPAAPGSPPASSPARGRTCRRTCGLVVGGGVGWWMASQGQRGRHQLPTYTSTHTNINIITNHGLTSPPAPPPPPHGPPRPSRRPCRGAPRPWPARLCRRGPRRPRIPCWGLGIRGAFVVCVFFCGGRWGLGYGGVGVLLGGGRGDQQPIYIHTQ